MITSSINIMRSAEKFRENIFLSNDSSTKKEDIFNSNDSSNINYNSNFDLSNEKIYNKHMILTNKDDFEEQTDERREIKNIQFQYDIRKSPNLEQNCKINNNCIDLEKNVIIKEEIVIPDVSVSDQQSNEFIREDGRCNNKTMTWLNAKSILKPKIFKHRDRQEEISISNVTSNQLIIQRKSKNNVHMIVGIVDTNTPPPEGTGESVKSGNEIPVFSNDNESSLKVIDNIKHLEYKSVLKSSINYEKQIMEQTSAIENKNEYLGNMTEVLKTVRNSRKHPSQDLCINGFSRILKNIAKLQQEKMLKKAAHNLKQTHINVSNCLNHSEENNSNNNNNNNNNDNNNTLNIKIENVVSLAKSLLKNTVINSPNVIENKTELPNPVPQAKSILKPNLHILDTKSNKIIVMQSESSGRTKLFRAEKIVTPEKIIEQMKSKCLLFCSVCSSYQKISWNDKLKKCSTCFKKMKYMCYECKESFASSAQFYAHDMCSCKFKLMSGYWKCNDCNYLVHKMTNCHERFCKNHPSLKCKYCSSVTIHLSEFTKYSIKKSFFKKSEVNTAISTDTNEDNLGIEIECTPLSSMPGRKLNSERNFALVCTAGCKSPAGKSNGSKLCSHCGLVMRYKCPNCEVLLKTYNAINKHCGWCCSSVRIYYCANCDVFSRHRYDGAPQPPLVPAPPAGHSCRNCLARFDSRGKLNVHRLSCDESVWLQCGLCPFKFRSRNALRVHLEELHLEHTNFAQRTRVFKFALESWRRSIDLLKWKVDKISDSEKNRLRDEKMPSVLLERLPEHVVQNSIDEQELRTCEVTTDSEDILPHNCDSIMSDEVDDQTTVDQPSFFNSQQTAYLDNINSLLVIPDSDEEASTLHNNLLIKTNQSSEIPFKTEKQVSRNKTSITEKLSQRQVPVRRPTSHVRRRRIRKRQNEPLRCEHCSYLTNAKKELIGHIMGRHAARLFRGVGFDCPRCSCVFSNYYIYERHLQSRHRLQR